MGDKSFYTILRLKATGTESRPAGPGGATCSQLRVWLEGRFRFDGERIVFVAVSGLIYRVHARRGLAVECDVVLKVLVQFIDRYLIDVLAMAQARPTLTQKVASALRALPALAAIGARYGWPGGVAGATGAAATGSPGGASDRHAATLDRSTGSQARAAGSPAGPLRPRYQVVPSALSTSTNSPLGAATTE